MHKRNLRFHGLVCLIVLIMAGIPAMATTVTLSPIADTSLFQNNPDNNLGGHTNFAAGTMANGSRSRAIVEFDPGSLIPAGSIITSVTLTLNVTAAGNSNPTSFELHPMLVNWGEGNKTGQTGAPASPGEATWNAPFASTTLWGTPGGQSGNDYAAGASASTSIGTSGAFTFASTSSLVSDVQTWLDNPGTDFGWMLLTGNESTLNSAHRFASREDGLGRGPLLTIAFSPVPEPSTMALVTLGTLGFFSFRRFKSC
ncbi:PEP-CTERM sorting domain-containing protein [Pedosphaera parvula]|uniref:Ice-binding protein C-terminal domain-containing protein n=1 Tax=Pedosphaera parvula (strain Ellin514) TaxID=320771 RepID=B9XNG5_PEDPL|nr:DNRLRE domain-containing protein [Pedosphaera parvula]EEF58624.1 protein of unknown function DUF1555 [Pedosphaera parvula Ellin514]